MTLVNDRATAMRTVNAAILAVTRFNHVYCTAKDIAEWLMPGCERGSNPASFETILEELYGAEEIAKWTRLEMFEGFMEDAAARPATHDLFGSPVKRKRR